MTILYTKRLGRCGKSKIPLLFPITIISFINLAHISQDRIEWQAGQSSAPFFHWHALTMKVMHSNLWKRWRLEGSKCCFSKLVAFFALMLQSQKCEWPLLLVLWQPNTTWQTLALGFVYDNSLDGQFSSLVIRNTFSLREGPS